MKKILILSLLLSPVLYAQNDSGGDVGSAAPSFTRNNAPHNRATRIKPSDRGTGLAPTTWGFAAQYQGSLYGSGYYPFGTNATYSGYNSIGGYTFNYPSIGFTNEIRAIYAFDVSSIGGVAGPVWSSFMFDTRETPNVGTLGLSAFAGMAIVSDGTTHTLEGLSLFQQNNAANLDIYDAEDFENANPFANPQLAFSGSNPLLGTVPVTTGVIVPISFNVTSAVDTDINPADVPTLGTAGLAALMLLLAGAGMVIMRRKHA